MSNWRRNIVLYLCSQTISLFGSALVQYSIMWYITLETKSGLMMTVYIICGFLPTLVLSPFAGVWADRYNRKLLIMLSDSSIAISTVVMALLFMLGYKALWMIFVISAIRAFGTAVQTPASSSLLPVLVPNEQLTRVNGINSSIQSLTMLISPIAGGALMSLVPLEFILFIDVSTAIIGVSMLGFLVKVPYSKSSVELKESGYIKDMALGFRYIKEHSFLTAFFLYMSIILFLAATPAFLTPLQVTRSFGSEVWRLTAIEISFSLGMLAGGVLITWWGGFKNRFHTMLLGNGIMGIFTMALGLTRDFWLYLGFMSIIGIALPLFNTPAMVLIQEKVEDAFLGRVFSVSTMISSSMMPLGMLLFGPLSDMKSIETLLLISGFLTLLTNLIMIRHKALAAAGGA